MRRLALLLVIVAAGCVTEPGPADSADDAQMIASIDAGKADARDSSAWVVAFQNSWDDRTGEPPDLTDAELATLPKSVSRDRDLITQKLAYADGEISFAAKLAYHDQHVFVLGYMGDTSASFNGTYFYTARGTLFTSSGDHGVPDQSTWDITPHHPDLDPVDDTPPR